MFIFKNFLCLKHVSITSMCSSQNGHKGGGRPFKVPQTPVGPISYFHLLIILHSVQYMEFWSSGIITISELFLCYCSNQSLTNFPPKLPKSFFCRDSAVLYKADIWPAALHSPEEERNRPIKGKKKISCVYVSICLSVCFLSVYTHSWIHKVKPRQIL